jgi:hypothetical protein
MRKPLPLAAAGVGAWLLLARRRRRHSPAARVVVGFADGSSENVDRNGFEHEALVAAAREALVP